LPLDPAYPQQRLAFMLEDAGVGVLLTQRRLLERLPVASFMIASAEVICLDTEWPVIAKAQGSDNLSQAAEPDNLAYLIYTSGSTGKPKGVMVNHRNVLNFFTGMDDHIGGEAPGTWLSVTSIAFDISVLELLWTLARGFEVVIQSQPQEDVYAASPMDEALTRPMDFSLFYFASDEGETAQNKYRLLLEGAKFADANGFQAVWTPERHFHAFGGLYPNPSVTSAAIAAVTERIQIRAGSVVLPLHEPLRVAEEWSMVDNLSNGRAAISFASGWNAKDFALKPENYEDRHEVMFRQIETVRRLWRGESITALSGAGSEVEVKILPRPIQPELPVWVTAAGSPQTFRRAGEIGANLLTHLLGQNVEELAEKINVYREAWREHGHEGKGHVTLMLHTFIGEDIDSVRANVRKPLIDYLMSSVSLGKNMMRSMGYDTEAEHFNEADLESLLSNSFDRYFEQSGLLGTPRTCLRMISRLSRVGVDEVACLIDFGVDPDAVLASLHHLNAVRELCNEKRNAERQDYSLPAQIRRHKVTHMQSTPSMAKMLATDETALNALGSLRKLLLGGEELPAALADQLRDVVAGDIHNMYGPTETTIWSSTHKLGRGAGAVSIGRPIANTKIHILDPHLQPTPIGVPGEIFIGGLGVVRGYLKRADTTAEKFIPNPFGEQPGERLYRTGDLGRYMPSGDIEFLGRLDYQVKLRGYRIELGEIESALAEHPSVRESVVVVRDDESGDKRLVAYLVPFAETAETTPQPTINELRNYLKDKLPEYMIPATFMTLDALPLTSNGKLNRGALPAPEGIRPELEVSFVAPQTETEQTIARVWQEVLGIEKAGIHDNFFDLGGNSLLLVRVHSKLRDALKRDVTLIDMFRHPTISSLSDSWRTEQNGKPAFQQAQDRAGRQVEAMNARRQGMRERQQKRLVKNN
jgi:natural product biosynthesis luciferase-like monooxygenase protein